MKKINSFGSSLVMGCRQRGSLLVIVAVFCLCMAGFTSATAQAKYVFHKEGSAATTGKTVQATANKGVTFYPGVVSDYLLVMLPAPATSNMLVTLKSEDGKSLATETIAAGATNTVVDMKHMPPGTYVVTIDNAAETTLRLVKN